MRDTLTPHTQTNLSAPSPTVLDIYVVWHPKDKCGRDVFDRLVNHYHSEHFSGLAGSAIEVFSRSHPRITGCDAPAPIPTRCGTVDTTAHDEQTHNQDSASDTASPFTVIIPVIGRHMIKASEDKHSAWPRYLKSLHTLRETASSAATPSVLIFPIIGKQGLDISIPPISALTSRQGAILHENAHAPGELVRDIGQAIIQNLLWKQAGMASSSVSPRLRVFISHARADIPETDLTGSSPTGVVSKVKQLAEKTHLETFFDIHDIQAGRSGTPPYGNEPARALSSWCARIITPAASGRNGKYLKRNERECLSFVFLHSAPERHVGRSYSTTSQLLPTLRSPQVGHHQKGRKRRILSTRPLSLL